MAQSLIVSSSFFNHNRDDLYMYVAIKSTSWSANNSDAGQHECYTPTIQAFSHDIAYLMAMLLSCQPKVTVTSCFLQSYHVRKIDRSHVY